MATEIIKQETTPFLTGREGVTGGGGAGISDGGFAGLQSGRAVLLDTDWI